jgi:heavy metal sensor kinase
VAFAGVVYGRASREAHAALRSRLLLRAKALAGLIEFEVEPDYVAYDLELPYKAIPEYGAGRREAYFVIHDPEGDVFLSSPSLGEDVLPPPRGWDRDGTVWFDEVESGPGDRPCAMVTLCYLVQTEADDDDDDGDEPPAIDEEARRFRIQVALDVEERDESLASLLWFLAMTGGGATLLALLGGMALARRVLRPVRAMTETARDMTPDDPTRRLEPGRVVTELDSLATTLNSAFDRLAAALAQQKRFIADASHELRTPVSILLSNAELMLRRDRTADEYHRGLERQAGTARRMASLIEDLLTLARADAGRCEIDWTRIDLARVADSVCGEHAALAERNGIALTCEAETGVEIEGDPQRLGQLLGNLVSNALKFVPRGGHVGVSVWGNGAGAVLTVKDDGPGIPEPEQARIFERFFRGEEQRARGKNGTGLGLAIAAWVAEVHGGRIEVESRVGVGATFRVLLPRSTGAGAGGV